MDIISDYNLFSNATAFSYSLSILGSCDVKYYNDKYTDN